MKANPSRRSTLFLEAWSLDPSTFHGSGPSGREKRGWCSTYGEYGSAHRTTYVVCWRGERQINVTSSPFEQSFAQWLYTGDIGRADCVEGGSMLGVAWGRARSPAQKERAWLHWIYYPPLVAITNEIQCAITYVRCDTCESVISFVFSQPSRVPSCFLTFYLR